MDDTPRHQLSALASTAVVLGGTAYCVGQVAVAFVFRITLTVIHAFVRADPDTVQDQIIIPHFNTAIFAGSIGLALFIFCAPRARYAILRRTTWRE